MIWPSSVVDTAVRHPFEDPFCRTRNATTITSNAKAFTPSLPFFPVLLTKTLTSSPSYSSSFTMIAFAYTVFNTSNSAQLWNRGMPPPTNSKSSPSIPTGAYAPSNISFSVFVTRHHFHSTLKSRTTHLPHSNIRSTATANSSSPSSPSLEEQDPESTVRSYVRDIIANPAQNHPESAQFKKEIDRIQEHLSPENPRAALFKDNVNTQTAAVHAGERVKGGIIAKATLDSLTTPLVMSSTYTFRNTAECIQYNQGTYNSFEYGRYGNPTTRTAELKIAKLDEAEDAVVSASGMCAVTTMLLALVPQNGHVISTTDCYRRTRQFVQTMLPKMGIKMSVIDPADTKGLERILKENNGADLFFSESPTNPLIRLVDTPKIVSICKQYNVITCIDTTFCTPFCYKPTQHGVDLVLHSGTKYLAGHNDVLCGALAGRADLIARVRSLQGILGGVIDPHAAWLLIRGMKTLGLRMKQHNDNVAQIIAALHNHPKVSVVHHPSLPHHPDHQVGNALYKKGYGGVFSFEIKGDGNPWSQATFEATGRFVDHLRIPYIGPSLGGVESIVEQVCIMGYFDQPLKIRASLGITNGLIRFSTGIEDPNDLVADILQALDHA